MSEKQKSGFFAKRKADKAERALVFANFREIAKASFEAATTEGLTETSDFSTLILAPESQEYKERRAAYLDKPDTYRLFTSLEKPEACGPWMKILEAEERRKKVDFELEFNESDGTYSITSLLMNIVKHKNTYHVAEGRFVSAKCGFHPPVRAPM
jgi:hypothetical protein